METKSLIKSKNLRIKRCQENIQLYESMLKALEEILSKIEFNSFKEKEIHFFLKMNGEKTIETEYSNLSELREDDVKKVISFFKSNLPIKIRKLTYSLGYYIKTNNKRKILIKINSLIYSLKYDIQELQEDITNLK